MGEVALLNANGSCLQYTGTTPAFSGTVNGQGVCNLGLHNDFLVYAADDASGVQYVTLYYLSSGNCLTASSGSGLQLTSSCVTTDPNQQFSMTSLGAPGSTAQFYISPRAFPKLCVVGDSSLDLAPCNPNQSDQTWSMEHQTYYQPFVSNSTVLVTTEPSMLNGFISWAFDQSCTPISCQSTPVHFNDYPGNNGGTCPSPTSGNESPFPANISPRGCDIYVSFNMANDFEPSSLGTGMDSLKALLMAMVQTQWVTNASYVSTGVVPQTCDRSGYPCYGPYTHTNTYTAYSFPAEVKTTTNRWRAQNSIAMSFNAFNPPPDSEGGCPAGLSTAANLLGVMGTGFDLMPLSLLGGIIGAVCS